MICSSSSINCSIDCPPRRPALSCRYIATENSQHAVEGMHANLLIGPVVHRPPSTATRGLPNLFPLGAHCYRNQAVSRKYERDQNSSVARRLLGAVHIAASLPVTYRSRALYIPHEHAEQARQAQAAW